MKRIPRDPEKFEVIDLFTAIGRDRGYKLNSQEDFEDFMSRISESFSRNQSNQRLIHGKRVESLFAHVVGALENCEIIKQEDAGEIFSSRDDILAPDYRIITKDGNQFLVEVKNCHFPNPESPYPVSKEYMAKLEKYSEINKIPFKIAIYFSRFNYWVLLSKESFTEQKNKYVTYFPEALAKSEMVYLGDISIGTVYPLSIDFIKDREKEASVSDSGEAHFIIGDIKLYAAEKEITNEAEKNIAFYLMQFGNWDESGPDAIMHDDEFEGVRFTRTPLPQEGPAEHQGFRIIGTKSSMISAAYREHTVQDEAVVSLDTSTEPEIFALNIPADYKSDELPLWRFSMKPNPEFQRG